MFGIISAISGRFKKEEEVEIPATETEEYKEFLIRLEKHEGLRLKCYRCTAGKLSIGIGRNLDDVGITEEEARFLLANDVASAEKELIRACPWVCGIDRRRYYVLVEMVFNLGIARFKQFKNMLAACEKGDFEKAANEALNSAWHKQVGKRAEVLAQVLKEG